MDQLKDFLRQAIKYRFWIAVGVSALLPMIAYAVGSGPIKQSAEAQTGAIKAADSDAKKYANGVIPNQQYKPLVDKEKETITRDVAVSHAKLYQKQAPLLTWPATVEERFKTWGRKWPENTDPSQIQLAIIDYVTAYPKYVNQVYQTFRPYDPIEGTGVVLAPPEAALLRPSQFTIEHPPELGKVWSAQERLWIQRTLLQVVADVNRDATDWSTAIIKQINQLEVGNTLAQDQLSLAKGDLLEPAPPLTPPGAAPPPPPAAGAPSGGGGPASESDDVYYIKTTSTKYKILPFQMTVLIEQDRIQDFLVALENSPMAIQVVDFEESKPVDPVVKPQKGEGLNAYGGGMPGSMNPGGRVGNPGVIAFNRRLPGPGGPVRPNIGKDVRGTNREIMRKKDQDLANQTAVVTVHDPYYHIVEVTVYGQARFYNPPPPEPVTEPSPSATPPEATAAAPDATAPPAATTPPAEATKAEATKPEATAPGATPGQPETKADQPAPKADQPAPKAESPATPPAAPEGAAPRS